MVKISILSATVFLNRYFHMKTLRYIVLALFFLLLVAVVVGFFLPSKVHLQRSVVINRDPATIFKVINSLHNFNKWSPWYDLDRNASYQLTGKKSGVGSKLTWSGNEKVGTGSNEIIESVKNSHIKTIMYFGKSDAPAYSILTLTSDGENKTKVTWAFENDFGMNIFYRYFGLVIEDMIAPDYERGLQKLKKHVEALPFYDYSAISTVTTEAQNIYTYASSANRKEDNISEKIGQAYAKIIAFLTKNAIAMNGTPKIINKKFDADSFEFIAAIPVVATEIVDETGEIKAAQTYAGKALKIIHQGSYKNFKQSYTILNAYIAQNKLQKNGHSWEDYLSDPSTTAQDQLITHIYQPIF